MEAKWPFIIILFFFVGLTGYIISQLERSKVMGDWDNRRCDLSVMVASRFFKPDTDPRSPEEFSTNNFEFCIKQFSDSFMNIFMAPITALVGKQANLTGGAMNALNQVREVVKRVTDAFMTYISSYLKKFQNGMFEFRRIIAYLRMGIGRLMAVVTSSIYIGLTLFSGMLSSIQVVIRVVLIICAIMLIVIIILWFILLPIIPFILTTLTAVVSLVVALSVVMSGSIASEAESQKSGFCFAEHTLLSVKTTGGVKVIPIRQVQVGDIISHGPKEHRVTAIMKMTSKDVGWYELDGIFVAGDHMVHTEDGWRYVKEDSRAHYCSVDVSLCSPSVYCLNTESHMIPIQGKSGETYSFRDWEELEDDDEEGHQEWRKRVLEILNGSVSTQTDTETETETKDTIDDQPIPLVGEEVEVWTPTGWKWISMIKVGDEVCRENGDRQTVLGIVIGESIGKETDKQWNQGGWIKTATKWKRRVDTKKTATATETATVTETETETETVTCQGWNLITESGEWVCRDEKGVKQTVCDFTEVGHVRIRELYQFVSRRLRI